MPVPLQYLPDCTCDPQRTPSNDNTSTSFLIISLRAFPLHPLKGRDKCISLTLCIKEKEKASPYPLPDMNNLNILNAQFQDLNLLL